MDPPKPVEGSLHSYFRLTKTDRGWVAARIDPDPYYMEVDEMSASMSTHPEPTAEEAMRTLGKVTDATERIFADMLGGAT